MSKSSHPYQVSGGSLIRASELCWEAVFEKDIETVSCSGRGRWHWCKGWLFFHKHWCIKGWESDDRCYGWKQTWCWLTCLQLLLLLFMDKHHDRMMKYSASLLTVLEVVVVGHHPHHKLHTCVMDVCCLSMGFAHISCWVFCSIRTSIRCFLFLFSQQGVCHWWRCR